MNIVTFESNHVAALGGNVERYAGLAEKGIAYTAMNGKPVFCGGAVTIWPGVAEVWFFAGPDLKSHAVSGIKAARAMIADGWERLNLHRLQATVKASDEVAVNFAQHFGFEYEGLLKQYNPAKEDFIMFARLK